MPALFLPLCPAPSLNPCTLRSFRSTALTSPLRRESPFGASPPLRSRSRRPLRLEAALSRPDDAPDEHLLKSFADSSRGEWVGYEGRFDCETGNALTIPDYYIPEQFLEWALTPKGFETNHSVIVRGDKLYRKFFRILPTVSLFADHVDLEEDLKVTPLSLPLSSPPEPQSGQLDIKNKSSVPVATSIFHDGSFVSGPSKVLTKRESKLDKWPSITFCIHNAVDGEDAAKSAPSPESGERKSANLWFSFDFATRKVVGEVRAVIESWSCDYCDGADLEGSSGFVDGWPSQPCETPDSIAGQWTVHHGTSDAQTTIIDRPDGQTTDADGQSLFLPRGLHISIHSASASDSNAGPDSVVVQAAWLVSDGTRVVLKRYFQSDGSVAFTERVIEVRA